MNPIKAIKLALLYEKFQSILKENAPMNLKVGPLLTLFGSLSATLGLPSLFTSFVHTHPSVYLVIVAAAVLLHSIMPSIFGDPNDADKKATGLGMILFMIAAFGLLAAAPVSAQSAQGTDLNIYAVGPSYSVNASPAIAGTGLYAHCFTDSGTCGYTTADMVPNTLKPFTVTSNIGVGVAQKVLTFGKMPVYCVTGAGPSWTGTNVGWQYNGGCLGTIAVKSVVLFPTVRFLKSSVSNGSGYQPIIGIMIGKTF